MLQISGDAICPVQVGRVNYNGVRGGAGGRGGHLPGRLPPQEVQSPAKGTLYFNLTVEEAFCSWYKPQAQDTKTKTSMLFVHSFEKPFDKLTTRT